LSTTPTLSRKYPYSTRQSPNRSGSAHPNHVPSVALFARCIASSAVLSSSLCSSNVSPLPPVYQTRPTLLSLLSFALRFSLCPLCSSLCDRRLPRPGRGVTVPLFFSSLLSEPLRSPRWRLPRRGVVFFFPYSKLKTDNLSSRLLIAVVSHLPSRVHVPNPQCYTCTNERHPRCFASSRRRQPGDDLHQAARRHASVQLFDYR